jgi:hypothetical protein
MAVDDDEHEVVAAAQHADPMLLRFRVLRALLDPPPLLVAAAGSQAGKRFSEGKLARCPEGGTRASS